ncbi:MAG: hypothetical protein IJZ16_00425 [Clostridia bacterium]|nr:hypothetical protein [Clostridia bacterium]
MKKYLSMIMAVILMLSIFSTSFISQANEIDESENAVMPRWTSINSYTATLNIRGLTATADASLTPGYATYLKITIQLQKETSTGYEDVETWTTSKTSGVYLSLNKSKVINPLNDYRLRITYTADQESIVVFRYP